MVYEWVVNCCANLIYQQKRKKVGKSRTEIIGFRLTGSFIIEQYLSLSLFDYKAFPCPNLRKGGALSNLYFFEDSSLDFEALTGNESSGALALALFIGLKIAYKE